MMAAPENELEKLETNSEPEFQEIELKVVKQLLTSCQNWQNWKRNLRGWRNKLEKVSIISLMFLTLMSQKNKRTLSVRAGKGA